LTQEQFVRMKQAVQSYRDLRKLLAEMERLPRTIIFATAPHPARRKRLSPNVLGTDQAPFETGRL